MDMLAWRHPGSGSPALRPPETVSNTQCSPVRSGRAGGYPPVCLFGRRPSSSAKVAEPARSPCGSQIRRRTPATAWRRNTRRGATKAAYLSAIAWVLAAFESLLFSSALAAVLLLVETFVLRSRTCDTSLEIRLYHWCEASRLFLRGDKGVPIVGVSLSADGRTSPGEFGEIFRMAVQESRVKNYMGVVGGSWLRAAAIASGTG
ncbi:hypothetical protein AXG93_4773s1250 [Marchantia polymorpha subsp. ruderalis]|uniref:Uncharacterized protein n=1 Tax=Marchantia polymorpha subsp. ruderalis TaxID=1480154 RepID=A0A176WLG9_MARPO|nr:hypothetical protein AXG93_4773s1250 [Marchantia polymorpha subsp. ruderalis]